MIRIPASAVLATFVLGALGPAAAAGGADLQFGPPTRVSQEMSEAWEPSMLIDRHGNIYMHARRATSNLVIGPDENSATRTRSMSWLWASSDAGASWHTLPGFPLDVQNHEWGYEGDFALDDADHLYFVDQTYADS